MDANVLFFSVFEKGDTSTLGRELRDTLRPVWWIVLVRVIDARGASCPSYSDADLDTSRGWDY
jgi:hypothetical protein